MRYLGSKARIKNEIIPIITKHLNGHNEFIDAFVGGANLIDSVNYNKKVGLDVSKYPIAIWNKIKDEGTEWIPQAFDDEEYYDVKNAYKNGDRTFSDAMIGYVGNCLSYGSKWWGGFARFNPKKNEDHVKEAYNGIKKQHKNFKYLETTEFINCSYDEYHYKPNSVIYCDPPYQSTIGYESSFDHEKFWQWCREMSSFGHHVYISEYSAPYDFKCIWRKSVKETVGKNINQKVEKLFVYNPKAKYIED